MRDVQSGVRLLARDPWFSSAAILALALGIAVNATVFAIIDGMLFRDLPFKQPETLVALYRQSLRGNRREGIAYSDYVQWAEVRRGLSALAAYVPATMNVGDEGRSPERFSGAFVSANTFTLLGVHAKVGRDFLPEDDRASAPAVVVLGFHAWSNRYAADPLILGRQIRVNGVPSTVIGIMPEAFQFPRDADVWRPLGQMDAFDPSQRVGVIGRLSAGATVPQARAELQALATATDTQHAEDSAGMRTTLQTLNEFYYGTFAQAEPLLLSGAVVFVLLIACANVANLLLARSAYRAREIAVRVTLGASRYRIIRQLLTESILLACVAGAVGLVLATGLLRVVTREFTILNLPYWTTFTIDRRVFAFLAAICLGTGILFGLAPAWRLSKISPGEVLKEGGRGVGGGRRARRWTGALLVSELALGVTLLAGATLLIRSARTVQAADRVIDSANILTARLTLPVQSYPTPEARWSFYHNVERRLSEIPGSTAVAVAGALPFIPAGTTRFRVALGDEHDVAPATRTAVGVPVTDRYFETLGLRILSGRGFKETDGLRGQANVIVNERFASLYLPHVNPIGARVQLTDPAKNAPEPTWRTVVGVSPSVRQAPPADPEPVVYVPLRSMPQAEVGLIVRGQGDSTALAPVIRREISRLDPDLPLYRVASLSELSDASRWTTRVISALVGFFAGIAMLLAGMGLYAVVAYGVSQRTQEIGIRLALGAQRGQVAWLVLRDTVKYVAVGATIGIAGAIGVGRILRGALVRTSPTDPLVLMITAALLAGVAIVASLVPTTRACRLDPATTLRSE